LVSYLDRLNNILVVGASTPDIREVEGSFFPIDLSLNFTICKKVNSLEYL